MTQETTTKETTEAETGETKSRFDRARDAVSSASDKVKEKVSSAGDSVKKTYASASEKAKTQYGEVRDKVKDIELEESIESARNWVRENPGTAVLLSVGVGFLIGLILRRDDD